MEPLNITPEKQQRTIWFLTLLSLTIPVLIGFIILSLITEPVLFIFFSLVWLVIAVLIAIWLPAFYKSLEYVIDDEGVKGKRGVFWRKHATVFYQKITNVDVTQGPVQRLYNIGTIHVQTAGAGGQQGTRAELQIIGVKDYDQLKNTIMAHLPIAKPSTAVISPDSATVSDESAALSGILDELKAIRQLLEKQGN
ncbi:hypothetical protein CEE37_12710 [candidate division LCP-89 bacterium B3_LCP]|uniref:YdbS-like PH domain-containing protein n=1 Tax=candidate division LCP-89 bacterium B3_LCP TaxID=2012998 RepID=A0A532UTV3_UNCL8|nr:MAG: hypothetical protein CEE37_12710 [candidate division LCP-89 bacterium B3_LCP]